MKLTMMFLGISTVGSVFSLTFFLPSLLSILNNQNYTPDYSLYSIKDQPYNIFMNSISFDPEKDHQLQQLLLEDHQVTAALQDIIFSTEESFPDRLSLVETIPPKLIEKRLSTQIRNLIFLKLHDRLRQMENWSKLESSESFHYLSKLCFAVSEGKEEHKFKFLRLFLDKVKAPESLIFFLQRIIVKEHMLLINMEEQTTKQLKHFLMGCFGCLRQTASEEQQQYLFEGLTEENKRILKMKVYKVFSHAFPENLNQLDFKAFFQPENFYSLDVLREVVLTRSPNSEQLIKQILSFQLAKKETGLELSMTPKVRLQLISWPLLSDIFSKTSEGHSCLLLQSSKEEEKTVYLRYNFFEFPEEAFSNQLPHHLAVKDGEKYKEQSAFFLDRFREILSILNKIAAKWTFFYFQINCGKITQKQCGEAETIKIIEKILLVWENILKQMKALDNGDTWDSYGTYHQFHKSQQCKPEALKDTIQLVLTIAPILSRPALERVANILYFLEQVYDSNYSDLIKNKSLMTIFIQQIRKSTELEPQKQLPLGLIYFLINYLDTLKRAELNIDDLPVNSLQSFQLIWQCTLQEKFFDCFSISGPSFFGSGLFCQERDYSSIYEQTLRIYPNFLIFVNQQWESVVGKMNLTNHFLQSAQNNLIQNLVNAISRYHFQPSEALTEKLRKLVFCRPDLFSNIENSKVKYLLTRLKIQLAKEEQIVLQNLTILLKSDCLLSVDPKILIENFWTNNENLVQLKQLLQLWNLILADSSKLYNPDRYQTYRQIWILLKRLEFFYKDKIVAYLSSLNDPQLEALKQLYCYFDNSLLSMVLTHHTEIFADKFRTALQQSSMPTIYQYLIGDGYFIKKIRENQNDHYSTRSIAKWTYKCLDAIASGQRQFSFGPLFYQVNKQFFQNTLKPLFLKLKPQSRCSDWGEDSNSPTIEKQVIEIIINSKKQGKDTFNSYYQNLNSYILTNIEELIKSSLKISTSIKSVLLNNKKFKGYKNLVRVQKSLFIDFVRTELTSFNPEYTEYYEFVITELIDSLDDINRYMDQQQSDQIEQFVLQELAEPIEVLDSIECDKFFSQIVFDFISKMIEFGSNPQIKQKGTGLIQKIFQIASSKDSFQPQKQAFLKILLTKTQDMLRSDKDTAQQLCIQMKWVDLFLQRMQESNIKNCLTKQLIDRFSNYLQQLLSKERQENETELLQYSLSLLERFIPSAHKEFSNEAASSIKSLLGLIAKITEIVASTRTEIFASITLKLVLSSRPQLAQFSFYFLSKCKESSEVINRLLCAYMHKTHFKLCVEADVKGYFFKKQFISGKETIECKLSDFIGEIKHKYKDNFAAVRDQLAFYCSTEVKREAGNELIYLNYLLKDSFEYSRSIGEDFINYKPSEIIKTFIHSSIVEINQNIEDKIDLLQTLKELIHYCPILAPSILFHSVPKDQTTETFLQFMIRVAFTKDINQVKYFLAWTCLDHSSILQGKSKPHFLSEYVCYQIVKAQFQFPISQKSLIFILFLCGYKRFARMCNIKLLENQKSLRDYIEGHLSSLRTESAQSNQISKVGLIILAVLYRFELIQRLSPSFACKPQDNLYDHCFISFDVPYTLNQNKKILAQDLKEINSIDLTVQMQSIAQKATVIKELSSSHILQELKAKEITLPAEFKVSEELLEDSGAFCMSKLKLKEAKQMSSTNKNRIFRNLHRTLSRWYNEPENRNNSNFSDQRLFNEQVDLEQIEEQWSKPKSTDTLQPSRFAAEDFVASAPISQNQENEDSSDEEEQKFLKVFEKVDKTCKVQQKKPDQLVEINLTEQMLQILDKINDNLSSLNKESFKKENLPFLEHQNLIEFLKTKLLQTEFDLKEATMSEDDFEAYCLTNATKLERLPSGQLNKARLIEARMLQSYMQRRTSEEEIDYIIDTMDENYQYLSKLERIKTKIEDIYTQISEQQSKYRYLTLQELPSQVFSPMSDSLLWQVVSAFYDSTIIINVNSLVPFLQNRTNRSKLINTLLFILRDPFHNGVFPNKIRHYDQKQKKSEEQDTKFIRNNILEFIFSFDSHGLFQDQNYLSEQIGLQGLNKIKLELKPQLSQLINGDRHRPQVQIAFFALNSQLPLEKKVRALRKLEEIPECLLGKIVAFFNQLNTEFQEEANTELNRGKNRIGTYIQLWNSIKSQKNLEFVLRNKELKEQLRKQFPVEQNLAFNPFMLCLFMHSDVYSPQQHRQVHQILLRKGPIRASYIFYCNQALRFYSDDELASATWIKQFPRMYIQIFKTFIKYLEKPKKIVKEQFYRLARSPQFLHFQIKSSILSMEIRELVSQNNYSQEGEILAKRQKGIFQSAFEELRFKPNGFWLNDFDVRFIGIDGKKESGYGGGVAKEWYTYVTKGMVNLNYGLFVKTSKNYYYFNRQSWINPRHLQFFEFIGKIFALSIVRPRFFLAPSFSTLIYKMILGEKIEIQDIIEEFDEGEMLKNLQKMRQYTDDSLFCQTFVYEDKRLMAESNTVVDAPEHLNNEYIVRQTEYLQEKRDKLMEESPDDHKIVKVLKVGKTIELVPGGANIAVNRQNLEEFIGLTKEKIINIIVNQVSQQTSAFLEGFKKIISVRYLKKFTAKELRELSEGTVKIIVSEIKENANIQVGNSKKCLELFWEVLQQLSPEDKVHFMHHWTGIPKLPAGGIKDMDLQIRERTDEKRIFAHTCFSRIYLPSLETKEEVREAVQLAVNTIKQGLSIIED